MDDVIALAERAGAPVITTFKAKGQIADDHPLACGVLGRSGTPVASWVMNEADLLVVLGASFSNHTGIYRGHPIVQVDLDPLQLGKFHKVDVPVWGEVGVTSRAIAARCRTSRRSTASTSARRSPSARRSGAPRRRRGGSTTAATASAARTVFDSLSRLTPEGMVIAVDVGNNTYSFGRYFECKPGQRVLMSGYLGSIGFGYPAAIGAWAATGEPVLAVTGDGGFGQYMGEILTAVKHDMNITHVLLEQRPARQDLQGAAGRQLGRLGDLAAQPRLLRVRADLRRARDPRDRRVAARRRDRPRARARRAGARRDRDGRRAHLTVGAPRAARCERLDAPRSVDYGGSGHERGCLATDRPASPARPPARAARPARASRAWRSP